MYEDIVGIKKKKSGIKCRECGSSNTEASHKMFTGEVFHYSDKVHKRYKRFVRCYDCGKTNIMVDSDITIEEPSKDVVNIVDKKITISLPILRNISPIFIMDEIVKDF